MTSFENRVGFTKRSIGVVALLLLATCLPALGRTSSRSENDSRIASSQSETNSSTSAGAGVNSETSAKQQPEDVIQYDEEEPEFEPEFASEYGRGYQHKNRPSGRKDAKPEGVAGSDATETVGQKSEAEYADVSKKVEASEDDKV